MEMLGLVECTVCGAAPAEVECGGENACGRCYEEFMEGASEMEEREMMNEVYELEAA